MGQSCGCNPKTSDTTQISTISNQEPYPKPQGSIYQSPIDQSVKISYNPVISNEFNLFRQFLQDSLIHTKNNKLRQQIYDISWDIQYFISTATNIFSFDLENWRSFIFSDEKQKILESFNNLNNEDFAQSTSEKPINNLDFEEWIRKNNNLQNQDYRQSKIHIYFLRQK